MKLTIDREDLTETSKDKSCSLIGFDDLNDVAQAAVSCVGSGRFEEYDRSSYNVIRAPKENKITLELAGRPEGAKPLTLFGWPTGDIAVVESNIAMHLENEKLELPRRTRYSCKATDVFMNINGVKHRLFTDVVGLSEINHIWLQDGPATDLTAAAYRDAGGGVWYRNSDNERIRVQCVLTPETRLWFNDGGQSRDITKEELERDYHREGLLPYQEQAFREILTSERPPAVPYLPPNFGKALTPDRSGTKTSQREENGQ